MTKRIYFTICSANYLAFARTLHSSLSNCDPEAARAFRLVLVDDPLDPEIASDLPFDVIAASDLGIANFWDMAMRYSCMELNTAVKPAAFLKFFEAADQVIYLDPDILVLRPLVHVTGALDKGAALVLTPHSTEPLDDGGDPDDVRLLRTGAYNLGFLAAARCDSTERFVQWWAGHMVDNCRVDLENGLFVDQKFLDLAPAYVEDAEILRHPGYNAAYWNLASRPVIKDLDGWQAASHPLHFFHFSGVVPGDKTVFSKHQNRFSVEDIGDLRVLLSTYLDMLESHGHTKVSAIPYAYGCFKSGRPISDIYRSLYAQNRAPAPCSRDAVFIEDLDLLNAPSPEVAQSPSQPLTRAMHEIWRRRPDLQHAYSLADPSDRECFARWFVGHAAHEFNLPAEAVQPVESALGCRRAGLADGVSIRTPQKWLAQAAIRNARHFRGLYLRLPDRVRSRGRDFLVRRASDARPSGVRALKGRRRFDAELLEGLAVYGYFAAVSGVGESARRMLSAVDAAGIPFASYTLGTNGASSEFLPPPMNARDVPSPYRYALFHLNAEQTPEILDRLPRAHLKGRYRIGYWAWELANFPEAWRSAFDYVDEVWVPSEFVRKAVAARTEKPVHIVPHPIPARPDSGETRSSLGLPQDRFLFLASFDLNSFRARKNPEGIYEAFRRAFPGKCGQGPQLVMKLHAGPHMGHERSRLVERFARDPRVLIIDMPMDDLRYAALQRNCDAYVSLHRSEGFGLNIAECMALGKPVVATAYSGSMDFTPPETCYLVDHKLVPVGADDYPHPQGQVWAEPDLDHAAQLLREIVSDPDAARARGALARQRILERFSPRAVSQLVRGHIKRIGEQYFARVA